MLTRKFLVIDGRDYVGKKEKCLTFSDLLSLRFSTSRFSFTSGSPTKNPRTD
jgi:hypothetical protein